MIAESSAGLPVADSTDSLTANERRHWETFQRKHLLTAIVRRRPHAPAVDEVRNTAEVAADDATGIAPEIAPEIATNTGNAADVAPPPSTDLPAARAARDTAPADDIATPAASRVRRVFFVDAAAGAATDPATDPAAEAERRSWLAIWVGVLAAAIGGWLLWRKGLPLSGLDLLLYMAGVIGVSLLGLRPLMGRKLAHLSLGGAAPLAWAAVTLAWPALAVTTLLWSLGAADSRWEAILTGLFGLLVLAVAVWSMTRVGTLLSMRAPWPLPVPANFGGWSSVRAWLALLLTLWLDVWLLRGTLPSADFRLPSLWPAPPAAESVADPAPLAEPAPLPAPAPAPAAAPRPAARGNANGIEQAARRTASRAPENTGTPASLPAPAADSVKPAADTAAKVAALLSQARAFDQAGRVEAAIGKLEEALKVEPGNAEIALALARGQRIAKQFDRENQTLRTLLAQQPRNPAAWLALGDNHLRLRGGSPVAIEEAAAYYLASFENATDRAASLKALRKRADEIGQESPRAQAAQRALDAIGTDGAAAP